MVEISGTPTGTGTQKISTTRVCFFVSAFGKTPDEQHRHKQVLKHLVQKVLEPRFRVIRADQIDDEGLITNQIIEHLLEDDLVIADLTGLNPNVFYEIAVRHAARKPIVHIITKGIDIPFDVANMRAVQYALDDPDRLEEAQSDLKQKVAAIEKSGWKAARNPITAARDVSLLLQSEQPEVREVGEVLTALSEVREEVRTLSRRLSAANRANPAQRARAAMLRDRAIVRMITDSPTGLTVDTIAAQAGLPIEIAERTLARLSEGEDIYKLPDGTWSNIPF